MSEKKQSNFFQIMEKIEDGKNNFSSSELAKIINKLHEVKRRQDRIEAVQRRREEQERQMREAQEEKERKDAHIREVTCMDLPLDWENAFSCDTRVQGVHAETPSDGLILSLSNLGQVDIEYIAAITGQDCKTVIGALKGSIFQNPERWGECFYKGWETADEYLSGNLIRKYEAAKQANTEYDGYFAENLNAIEKVLPPSVPAEDIYITLGSPWVPADVIDDFIKHLFGRWYTSSYIDLDEEQFLTKHDELTGSWEIPFKSRYGDQVNVTQTYGTERIGALHIMERTLNMRPIVVRDEITSYERASGKERIVNQEETVFALEKQKKLISAFKRWVWTDAKRKKRLVEIYDNRFGCVRRRIFDGSFLRFPGMSPDVCLYPYQKNAVARILFTPNTLLAHDVGAGKTYIMTAAGMELRRIGLSKKNMYVVPNNIVGQWKSIFLSMYPNAKLLCVEPKNFTPGKRAMVLEYIQREDFDGIIIAYSCFEQIPLSKDYYLQTLTKEQELIDDILEQSNKATSRLTRKKKAVDEAIRELKAAMVDLYDRVYFDELGVTRLFVDEAHNFKNVPFATQIKNILGVNPRGSKRCQDMMDKVRTVQRQNGGRGIVFATGTPITNSVADTFIMQSYLQSGELAMLDLQCFDSWIGMFAEATTDFEIDVDTNSYRLATRFSRFHNLPELTNLLASIADFHCMDSSAGIPETAGRRNVIIARTVRFADYLDNISKRADMVRSGLISRANDNMLKITTDGRLAALDLRLVDSGAVFTYQSKAARCAGNVADIYFRTQAEKSTQLIFCDSSTPKAGFNIYDEIKTLLIQNGIPADQIAFVHDADTEARRNTLFARVRGGEIRILLGSTFKLGLGVNIQDRLIALHHLDVPWRPADMTQREGRILRRGNRNKQVQIYRYITEGSFDAYSWQLLETKQRFISELLSGSLAERSGSDVDNTVLDYAEVKALAVGNPLVKERVETANKLTHFRILQRKLTETRLALAEERAAIPMKKENQRQYILACEADLQFYTQWKQENLPVVEPVSPKAEAERHRVLRELLHKQLLSYVLEPKERTLTTYRGFEIVLPSNMIREKPFVWLCREGRYYVELGDTDIGNLIRIDHYLDNLQGRLDELQYGLAKLRLREAQIEEELAKDENYSETIKKYSQKLEVIDKRLGVEKQ